MKAILFVLLISSPNLLIADEIKATCDVEIINLNTGEIVKLSNDIIDVNQEIIQEGLLKIDEKELSKEVEKEYVELVDVQIALEDQKIATQEISKKPEVITEKQESKKEKFKALLSRVGQKVSSFGKVALDKTIHYGKIAADKSMKYGKIALDKTKEYSKIAIEKSKELFNKGKDKVDSYNETKAQNKLEAKKQLVNFKPADPYLEYEKTFYNTFVNVDQNKLNKTFANEAFPTKYNSYYSVKDGEIYEVNKDLSLTKLTSIKLELVSHKNFLAAKWANQKVDQSAQADKFVKEIESVQALMNTAKAKLDKNQYDPNALIELNRANKVMSNLEDKISKYALNNSSVRIEMKTEVKEEKKEAKKEEKKETALSQDQSQNGTAKFDSGVEIIDVEF